MSTTITQTARDLSQTASRQVDRATDAASQALNRAHESADQALANVQQGAHDLARQAPGFVDYAVDRIKLLSEKGGEFARATGSLAADKARYAADQTAERIRKDPLKSVLIAVTAGAAIALITSHLAQRRQSGR
jgi:ElaB/YqjD/DUF883 family membrane-anchored ribosome-binding protein